MSMPLSGTGQEQALHESAQGEEVCSSRDQELPHMQCSASARFSYEAQP